MNRACNICHRLSCHHINPRTAPIIPPPMNIGEHVGEAMSSFSGVPMSIERDADGIPVKNPDTNDTPSTIPAASNGTKTRIEIPPPARIPVMTQSSGVRVATNDNDAPATPKTEEPKKESIIVSANDLPAGELIACNVCKAKIYVKYLTQHLRIHTKEYVPRSSSSSGNTTKPKQTTSSALTTTSASSASSTSTTNHTPSPKYETKKPMAPKLGPAERFRFRKIENASASASVSSTLRYNDFSLVLWLERKPTSYGNGYHWQSNDSERLVIHVVQDKVEDWFSFTCKILKRGSYSTYDTEEASIPERICYQEELKNEIKRALLFFGVNPRIAYRRFRKLFNADFVSESNKNGTVFLTETKNMAELFEAIKKSNTGNSSSSHWPHHKPNDNDYYGGI